MCLKTTDKKEQAKVLDYFIITKGMIKEMKDNTFAIDLDCCFDRLAKCLGNNYQCLEGDIVPNKLDYLYGKINDIKEQNSNVEPIFDDIVKISQNGNNVLPVCCLSDFYIKTCIFQTSGKEKKQYIKIINDFEFFMMRYIQAGGIVVIRYDMDGIYSDCKTFEMLIDTIKKGLYRD